MGGSIDDRGIAADDQAMDSCWTISGIGDDQLSSAAMADVGSGGMD